LRRRAGSGGALNRVELGRRAELAVADLLFTRGFRILGRNVRMGALELDVVARKGPLVVVVEVRTRGPKALVGAFESIGYVKRKRLFFAVERLWRRRFAKTADVERIRIDAAAVSFDGARTRVEYIEGALST
jgi:putative endonuclease